MAKEKAFVVCRARNHLGKVPRTRSSWKVLSSQPFLRKRNSKAISSFFYHLPLSSSFFSPYLGASANKDSNVKVGASPQSSLSEFQFLFNPAPVPDTMFGSARNEILRLFFFLCSSQISFYLSDPVQQFARSSCIRDVTNTSHSSVREPIKEPIPT